MQGIGDVCRVGLGVAVLGEARAAQLDAHRFGQIAAQPRGASPVAVRDRGQIGPCARVLKAVRPRGRRAAMWAGHVEHLPRVRRRRLVGIGEVDLLRDSRRARGLLVHREPHATSLAAHVRQVAVGDVDGAEVHVTKGVGGHGDRDELGEMGALAARKGAPISAIVHLGHAALRRPLQVLLVPVSALERLLARGLVVQQALELRARVGLPRALGLRVGPVGERHSELHRVLQVLDDHLFAHACARWAQLSRWVRLRRPRAPVSGVQRWASCEACLLAVLHEREGDLSA